MSDAMGWISGIGMLIVFLAATMYLPFRYAMGAEWRARHGLLGEKRQGEGDTDPRSRR
jgi:hypothetical protein